MLSSGGSSNLRQRNKGNKKAKDTIFDTPDEKNKYDKNPKSFLTRLCEFFVLLVKCAICLAISVLIGLQYAQFSKIMHENFYWFSNKTNVEREISFRTESGLYYSYFKYLTTPAAMEAGLVDGITQLTADNRTESWRSINILQRFNIYQEVLLAALYRFSTDWQKLTSNIAAYETSQIYFYINFVFNLHGVYLAIVFLIACIIGKSAFGAILAAAFFIFNKEHASRVYFTTPLRESFAIPLIYLQMLLIVVYLKTTDSQSQIRTNNKYLLFLLKIGIFLSGLLYSLFWQFSQFVILLQSLALFGIHLLSIIDYQTIKTLLLSNLMVLLFTFAFQFANQMILSSFALHFLYVALIFSRINEKYKIRARLVATNWFLDLLYSIIFGVVVLTVSIGSSILLKTSLQIDADDHIIKFVMRKLNLAVEDYNDFETRLYLCHSGFENLSIEMIDSLTRPTMLLPIYIIAQIYFLIYALAKWVDIVRTRGTNSKQESAFRARPDLIFIAVQALFFCVLAISTVRMKFLWTPLGCILASLVISDYGIFERTFGKHGYRKFLRHVFSICFIYLLYYQSWNKLVGDLYDLREFHDPDTVALMNWIKDTTPQDASFSGSMQLLAGVKCCTNRRLTNHPHFEDRELRDVTKNCSRFELYQMYAMKAPDEVYRILKSYQTDYIILEDSICLSPPKPDYCSLKEILDISNNHLVPRGETRSPTETKSKRFCDQIRHNEPGYAKFFKLAFNNPTFRVYKLN